MEIKPDMVFPPGGTPAAGQGDMMTSYHAMMTEFLRVQESVMRAYLQNGGAALPATSLPQMAPVSAPAAAPVAQPMPAPVAQPVPAQVVPEPALAVEAPAPAPVAEAPVSEPAPAAAAEPLVKPSKALPGEAELAARKGTWTYTPNA